MGIIRRLSSAWRRTRSSISNTRRSLPRRRPRQQNDNEEGEDTAFRLLHEADHVQRWIEGEGERTIQHIARTDVESLSETLNIQRKFERFHFNSMKYIDQGTEVTEELRKYIEENGDSQGLGNKAEVLNMQLTEFKSRLEERRQGIDGCIHIFSELNKAYEWALSGMKLAASFAQDNSLSLDTFKNHKTRLEEILKDYPPFDDGLTATLTNYARDLQQTEFFHQYELVEEKCKETHLMISQQLDAINKSLSMHEPKKTEKPLEDETDPTLETRSENNASSTVQDEARSTVQDETILNNEARTEGKTFTKGKEVRDRREITPKTRIDVNMRYPDSLHSNFSIDSGISLTERNQTRLVGDASETASIVPPSCDSNEGSVKQESTELAGEDQGSKVEESTADSHEKDTAGSQVESDSDQIEANLWLDAMTKAVQEVEAAHNHEDPPKSPIGPPDINRHIQDLSRESLPSSPEGDTLKHEKKMLLLMEEMQRTEQDYVSALAYTLDNYVPEMDREDIPHGLRGLRSVVFGNMEKIYQFHVHQFLPNLEKYSENPSKVGGCFLKYRKEFSLYSLYSKNKPKSDALLSEFGFFFQGKRETLDDRLDLASYLLKPVQRLGKYALLLQDLIMSCDQEEPEHVTLTDAVEMIHFQMRHGNDLLAMDHVRDVDFNIREQGDLIRQEEFLIYRGHRKALRHVFLFEEMIVFTKPIKAFRGVDEYKYKFSMKMSDIGLTENIGQSGLKFQVWYRRIRTGIEYTLQATTVQVKKQWTTSISRILWNQATRSKEYQEAELRSMGLESKPNLDLKPSKDMIENRSVNFRLSKSSRKRRSIPSGRLSEPSPATSRSSGSSWLGSPPPSITDIIEESPLRDFQSSEDRTISELDVTSLPDLTKNRHGGSTDSLGTVDTLNSRATDVQTVS
ncbi:uncharacterized protein [Apostichopus japonicus]|uniref:uncharacterized protein isoform X2 n=1 Tax=Stichopus japonicus TaxID=307972 RepID=UPI003AB370EA